MKLLILSLLFTFCANVNRNKKQEDYYTKCKDIESIDGFLTLSENYSKGNDTLIIRNNDNTIWHKFSFFYNDKDGQYEFYNENFKPFSFHPDYFNLFIGVTNKKEDGYLVNVNHEKRMIKSISFNDSKYLKYLSWDEFLLEKVYSIDFQGDYIYKTINGSKTYIEKSQDATYIPIKIADEWMKVKFKNSKNNDIGLEGWIQWRNGNCLLIELFYY